MSISNQPSKIIPILIVAVFLLSTPGFCVQEELTELQKQARLYRIQGYELQKEGYIEGALPYYQKALLVDPNYVVVYNDVGIIFEALGQPERAKEMYLKAIEISPSCPDSYSNLALLYEEQKDYANAILCWIRRAVLGGPDDPWAETARKRLEDIARIYPEAYRDVGQDYKRNLKPLAKAQDTRRQYYKEDIQQLDTEIQPLEEPSYAQPQEPVKVSLFSDEKVLEGEALDSKTRALQSLARAKENFSKGNYISALKEATVAEYLDSSNREISAFVEKVRKKLLQ